MALRDVSFYLNGSFTTKKRNPNDLDIVIFIEEEIFKKSKQLLSTKFNHDKLQAESRLDVYFIIEFPENHPNHSFTVSDRAYWVNQFTRTRPNRKGTVYKKGLLQLNLTKHEIEKV